MERMWIRMTRRNHIKGILIIMASFSAVLHFLNIVGYMVTIKYEVEHVVGYNPSTSLYAHQWINTLTFVVTSGCLLGMYLRERKSGHSRSE